MTEIKPCPFCGSEKLIQNGEGTQQFWKVPACSIKCGICKAHGPECWTSDSAIESWNEAHDKKPYPPGAPYEVTIELDQPNVFLERKDGDVWHMCAGKVMPSGWDALNYQYRYRKLVPGAVFTQSARQPDVFISDEKTKMRLELIKAALPASITAIQDDKPFIIFDKIAHYAVGIADAVLKELEK